MSKKEKERDPYELKDIYSGIELELVNSFKRNLLKHSIDEYNAGFSWEMWQSAMLRNLEEYRSQNEKIIGKARPEVKRAIEGVLQQSYQKGQDNVQQAADKAQYKLPEDGKNTSKVGEKPLAEENFFKVNSNKMKTMIDTTIKDFEKADQAIHRKMDDVYRQTINNAKMQLTTGSISLDKAIDIATEDFLAKGINCIAYKDKSGEVLRYVNITTYAEMALRTASQRATFLGAGSKRDELGVHLVFVSTHANCCELCFPWQGQILIDDVFSHPSKEYIAKYKDKYKLLSVAMKEGLLHPNCRHTLATYFEGITRIPKIYDKAEAMANYAAEQKQRQLENKIRLAKRIRAGVVEEDKIKEANQMILKYQKALRNHLKAHPELKRHSHREKIYDTANKNVSLGNGSNVKPPQSKGKYIETIDLKEIDKYIEKYENEIKDYPVEHAYIIHDSGKVMRYIGNDQSVSFPTNDISGAIITHNHPIIDGEPSNSFQKDDFSFLQSNGLDIKSLRATYGDLRYEVTVLKDMSGITYDQMMQKASENIDIFVDFVDFGDLIFQILDQEGYVKYAKTKIK